MGLGLQSESGRVPGVGWVRVGSVGLRVGSGGGCHRLTGAIRGTELECRVFVPL